MSRTSKPDPTFPEQPMPQPAPVLPGDPIVEPDAPVSDICGTCRACLDACPTQAFPEPYVLDARRCISYLTIEVKDAIDPALREPMGRHVFGCDICQDVCPWNRFEKPTEETRFEPRKDETAIQISEVLSFNPDSYAERFRRSAIKRAKLPALKRNASALAKAKH